MVSLAFLAIGALKLFAVYLGAHGQIGNETKLTQSRVPKYAISNLIHFPGPDKRDVACNSRFQNVSSTTKLPSLLLVPGGFYTVTHTTLVILYRDGTLLYSSRSSSGCEERRNSSCVGADTLDEGSLRH